jgi:hypothetical protein
MPKIIISIALSKHICGSRLPVVATPVKVECSEGHHIHIVHVPLHSHVDLVVYLGSLPFCYHQGVVGVGDLQTSSLHPCLTMYWNWSWIAVGMMAINGLYHW